MVSVTFFKLSFVYVFSIANFNYLNNIPFYFVCYAHIVSLSLAHFGLDFSISSAILEK